MVDLVIKDEIKELAIRSDELIDKSNIFMKIFTRGADKNSSSLIEFKTFNNDKLAKIAENMPEINRAVNSFGRQNSQTTSKLMSLNMIAQSPYRRLKQCLSQIERKRGALKENIFKIRQDRIKLDKLLYQRKLTEEKIDRINSGEKIINIKTGEVFDVTMLSFKIEEMEIKIQKIACSMSDCNIYLEGALKEIGLFQEAYNEIKENFNILDEWDEADVENSEIEEHVKTAFLHLIRDIEMTNRINCGTSEYLFQFGINPTTAIKHVREYLHQIESMGSINITVLYDFLDRMHEMFKDEYKYAMKRIGIKNLVSTDYLYLEDETEKVD